MLDGLSIRERLLLSYAILLFPILAVAAISLHVFQTLTDKTGALIDHDVRRVILAQNANEHAQAAAIGLLKILQTSERDKRIPLYTQMDAENAAAKSTFAELGRIAGTPESKAEVERILELSVIYADTFQETVELIELNGPLPAQRHFEGTTTVALGALLSATRNLVATHQQRTESEFAQLHKDSDRASLLAILLDVAASLTAGALAWTIARNIVIPIREAVGVAESIASGDYMKDVPVGKRDEVGSLLRALAVMRDSIGSREERILRLAYVDALTGLPNRTRFLELFNARSAHAAGVLIILDIDRFAAINKALGHAVGDRLLKEIALRLQQSVGESDVVGRLWGDEFALLLDALDKTGAKAFAEKILASLRAPIAVDGQRLDVDASLGIVRFPQDGTDTIGLMRRADLAMAAAKRRHDGFAFGAEFNDQPMHEQLSLIGEMREALERREFVVYYQPKLDLARSRVTGAEALIRWRHPDKGMIPPGNFIPFAEQTGFIREITPWILREAIGSAALWQRSGMEIVVSVNLSTHDLLNPLLVAQVKDLIDEYDLPAGRICLEITESALMEEPEIALRHLEELAALGLKLSIDDYGTGQASLAYVKSLPVHELKIDRAFVAGVDLDPKNAAIVSSTIFLCRELGLSVVAEGAETAAEIAWLRSKGCDLVQGYGVARPMPAADFFAWVRDSIFD